MVTKRQLQAQETKRALLDAGQMLLNEKGYDSISIEEITDACGVSKGSFYHYFKSKDEFFMSIEYRPFVELDEQLLSSSVPVAQAITEYIAKFCEHLGSFSPHYIANWLGRVDNPAFLDRYKEEGFDSDFADHRVEALRQCIEHGVERGELISETPTQELARTISVMLFGIVVWYCVTVGSMNLDEWASQQSGMARSLLSQYAAKK